MFDVKNLYKLNEDFDILKIPDIRLPMFVKCYILTVKTGPLEGLKFEFYDWKLTQTGKDSVDLGVQYKILANPKVVINETSLKEQINNYVMSFLVTLKDPNDRRY
jgi:hypothetical protein